VINKTVNKSLIKFIADFSPLAVFFFFYISSGKNLGTAIPPLIITTIISVFVLYYIDKTIPYIPLVGAVLISAFGGLTLYFDNPIFIYLKPTIINILFGLTLLISNKFFNKNFLKFFFQKAILLKEEGWNILNKRWAFFFFFLAMLNEFVWRTQSELFWVNFKVWGVLPLTIIFTGLQLPLIKKFNDETKINN